MSVERCLKRQRTESTEEEMPAKSPFSCEWKKSDAVLVVEGRKLHVHSLVLSLQSPVFEAMFTSGFAESSTKEVSLPGKKLKHVENLLKMIYTGFSIDLWKTPVNDIDEILSLVQEYMIDSVRKTIQEHFLHFFENKLKEYFQRRSLLKSSYYETIQMLIIADKYDFYNVICEGATYISSVYEFYSLDGHFSSFAQASGDHKFQDKCMVKFTASMINKHAATIKSIPFWLCKNCKENHYVKNLSKCSEDISKMSDLIMADSFLKGHLQK